MDAETPGGMAVAWKLLERIEKESLFVFGFGCFLFFGSCFFGFWFSCFALCFVYSFVFWLTTLVLSCASFHGFPLPLRPSSAPSSQVQRRPRGAVRPTDETLPGSSQAPPEIRRSSFGSIRLGWRSDGLCFFLFGGGLKGYVFFLFFRYGVYIIVNKCAFFGMCFLVVGVGGLIFLSSGFLAF